MVQFKIKFSHILHEYIKDEIENIDEKKLELFQLKKKNLLTKLEFTFINFLNYYNFYKYVHIYKNYNSLKLKKINNNIITLYNLYLNNLTLFFSNLKEKCEDPHIFLLNLKKSNPLINFYYNNLLILNIKSGVLKKKLKIESKKMKKDFKILKLMINLSINNIIKFDNKIFTKQFILNIKGTNINFLKILSIFRKLINLNKIIIVYSSSITNNFKFKKNKSIKKKLKKNFLRRN